MPGAKGWLDAHLDLAFLAECGRDMHTAPEDARGRWNPAAVTLPSLRDGAVHACLGTIFTEAVTDPDAPDAETGAFAYPIGDPDRAYVCGMRQLKLYHAWEAAGAISLIGRDNPANAPLRLGVLMECADPISSPDDLRTWADAGVIAIGMAWWHQSRYAQGNGVPPNDPGPGLTDLGLALVRAMDERAVIHDASHLSQRAVDELFEATDQLVVATHSNCRALMGDPDSLPNQRHLADRTIAEIARRGGVVGINLFSPFLAPDADGRATVDDCCAHIEHVCEIAGGRSSVGLGSDMDGGFGADQLPIGIDRPSDLDTLAEALRGRGWSDDEIDGFAWDNWARVLDLR